MKEIDEERKDLQKKLMRFEEGRLTKMEERDKSKGNSNYTTINEQIYKDYFGGRKVKVNKGRHVIDKLTSDKNKKPGANQKSGGNLHFVDGSIQINLSNNIVVSKKGSYDQHISKKEPGSHNSSIRCTITNNSRANKDSKYEASSFARS